jgi:hypothetical protein
MSLDEEFAIGLKALELKKQGKMDEYWKTMKSLPVPPYLARVIKDKWKAGDWLKESGWNLSEAEAEFGPGWLAR